MVYFVWSLRSSHSLIALSISMLTSEHTAWAKTKTIEHRIEKWGGRGGRFKRLDCKFNAVFRKANLGFCQKDIFLRNELCGASWGISEIYQWVVVIILWTEWTIVMLLLFSALNREDWRRRYVGRRIEHAKFLFG